MKTEMDPHRTAATEQAARWNGRAGQAWVEAQTLLDRTFKPFEDLLSAALSGGKPARRVLDVGCGAGGTTLAFARLLAPHGSCVGIDISEPMIAAARSRAEREGAQAGFIVADAQTHAFEPGGFDRILSRFGVMFFDDFVRAFENLRRSANDQARLRFIVWRSASENPFMTTAERVAAPLLPGLPERRPDGPGQFALADHHRVSRILQESGWNGIDIQPVDVVCTFPETALIRYFTTLGPLGLVLHEADEQTRGRVVEIVRPAFDPYVHGAEVRFTAACWMVDAQA
jgi:SAM-dependent methyltransferase